MNRLLALLTLMAVAMVSRATNTLTISSPSGHPGDEVSVEVSLDVADEATAVDISLPLNEQTSFVVGSCELADARSNGHSISANVKDGSLRILVYSIDLNALRGESGTLLSFKLKLGKEPADYALTPVAKLSDTSGKSLEVATVAGTATILSPKINVATTTIDFGRSAIRGTYTRKLTVSNIGNEPLDISAVEFSVAEFTCAPATATVAPGESQPLTVTYKPLTRAKGIEEFAVVKSNAVNGSQRATLTAIPYSVNELHIARVQGLSDEEVTVTISMNNMEPIVSAQCSFKLPDALVYVDGSAAVTSRGVNHVAYSKLADGVLTLFMISPDNSAVTGDDGELMTFRVKLSGTSGSYYLRPTNVVLGNVTAENMTSAYDGNYVVIKAPSFSGSNALDFGEIPVTEIAVREYAIRNTGQAEMTVDKVTFLAEGYSINTELPLTIAVGKSATLQVAYTPTAEGAFDARMNVYSNDPTTRMKAVDISGSVYEPNSISVSGTPTANYQNYTLHVDMTNYTEIVACQMDIHWLSAMTADNSDIVLSNRFGNHSATVARLADGYYRVIIFSLDNTPVVGNSGKIFDLTFHGSGFINSQISVDNIKMSNANGTNYTSPICDAVPLDVKLTLGDINGDEKLSVGDVTMLLSMIKGEIPNKAVVEAADINGDGKYSVADISSLIDLIIKGDKLSSSAQ